MAFQLSPGVNVSEIDLTTIVPAVSTSTGAIAGVFRWGPVNQPILVTNENDLANFFGTTSSLNPETWFTAASFLGYGSALYVVRTANTTDSTLTNGAISAFANSTSAPTANIAQVVLNRSDYDNKASFDSAVQYIAKYPGVLGSSLRISVCDNATVYASNVSLVNTANQQCNATFAFAIGSNTATLSQNPGLIDTNANTWLTSVVANLSVGDLVTVGNSSIGTQVMKISAVGTPSAAVATINFTSPFALGTAFTANNVTGVARKWEFASSVSAAPISSYWNTNFGNTAAIDTLHAVVVDAGGLFTGTPNTILEVFPNLSRATDAQSFDGASLYYKTVINNTSKYVWWANDRTNAVSNTAVNITSSTNTTAYNQRFVAGNDGYTESTVPLATLATGYSLFTDKQTLPISLVLQGKPTGAGSISVNGQTLSNYQLANFLIDNIGEVRKDCVVFITPDQALVSNNPGNEAQSLVNWATNVIHTSTYAVMDSGYKYMYDRYNDVYRYIPTNGDVAGLCARTDATNNAWWSPAGFNRGQIKNTVKLRWNPNQAARDVLYSNAINPVVTFPGQGTVLYGDKTFTVKPSAFDRINVRRLFIVIEKAIAQAAQYSLFEFNDDFTRAQFRNLITPYLNQVQALRGITDFQVVCDTTNNTAAVINANQFVGDIYIKPNRSINFIQLNFVAVRSGVDFSTVVGKF
jgi:phage tail sheath protein FI